MSFAYGRARDLSSTPSRILSSGCLKLVRFSRFASSETCDDWMLIGSADVVYVQFRNEEYLYVYAYLSSLLVRSLRRHFLWSLSRESNGARCLLKLQVCLWEYILYSRIAEQGVDVNFTKGSALGMNDSLSLFSVSICSLSICWLCSSMLGPLLQLDVLGYTVSPLVSNSLSETLWRQALWATH